MPSAFKILSELFFDLEFAKTINVDKVTGEFIDSIENFEVNLLKDRFQPMTEQQFFANILNTNQHSLTYIIERFPDREITQKLYLLTLKKVNDNKILYENELNQILLPLPLRRFTREIINDPSCPTLRQEVPLTVEKYIAAYESSHQHDRVNIDIIANELKESYQVQPGVDIDTIINTLSSFIKENPSPNIHAGITPFAFAMETLVLVCHPEYIHQKNSNLCGIGALLFVLLRYSPHIYVNIAIDLYKHDQSDTFFHINLPKTISRRKYFYEYVMIGIKQSYNYFGYMPDYPLLEAFGGITRPCALVNYLESFGYSDIHENIHFKNSNNNPIGVFHRFMVGGVYSSHHKDEQINDRFLCMLESALAQNKSVILSVGASDWTFPEESTQLNYLLSWVNIRTNHYISLVELKYSGPDEVYICFADSARGSYVKHTLTEQELIDVITGAIISTAPIGEPKLESKFIPPI